MEQHASGGNPEEFIARLIEDHRALALAPGDRALLDYAEKLTVDPGAMEEADVERLREHGFGDEAVHDLAAVTAYFAFVNRIADGLGVELEASGPAVGDG